MSAAPGPVFVLIGAGSTVFTPGLLHDLAGSPVFADADVRLVDVAGEAAETMAALGRRIAASAGSRMRVTAFSGRREALAGARFVATTRTFGLYPAPGDRHVAEFFGGYLTDSGDGQLAWGLQGGLDMTREYIDEKGRLWEGLRAQADGTEPVAPARNQEAERLVSIAAAVASGDTRVELAVNLPNQGLLPHLPASAVVEVPAVVSAAGIAGVAVPPLPEAVAAVLTARSLQQELVVDAAVSGSRSLALQALTLDPLVPDAAMARAILDDAVAADPDRLGRFAPP